VNTTDLSPKPENGGGSQKPCQKTTWTTKDSVVIGLLAVGVAAYIVVTLPVTAAHHIANKTEPYWKWW